MMRRDVIVRDMVPRDVMKRDVIKREPDDRLGFHDELAHDLPGLEQPVRARRLGKLTLSRWPGPVGTAGACSASPDAFWQSTWPSRCLESVPVPENRISHRPSRHPTAADARIKQSLNGPAEPPPPPALFDPLRGSLCAGALR